MSQLNEPLRQAAASADDKAHLPTLAELGRADRMRVAFAEVEAYLGRLPDVTTPAGGWLTGATWASWKDANPSADEFTTGLRALNVQILKALAVDSATLLAAYQLGRALSDTCFLPDGPSGFPSLRKQFEPARVVQLQSWLHQISDGLPDRSAATVSRSLRHWQDWVDAVANSLSHDRTWKKQRAAVVASLRGQSRPWRSLLAEESSLNNTTPPATAWVAAGQSMIRTARDLTSKVLLRLWPVAVTGLSVTGALVFLCLSSSKGSMQVWTTLVTVGGGLGITGGGLHASARKVTTNLEQSVWKAVLLDAYAWDITLLPTLPQGPVDRYRMFRRGLPVPNRARHLPDTDRSDAAGQA